MVNNNNAFITLIRATKDEIEEEYKEIIEGQIILNTTDKTISCDEKNERIVYVGNQVADAITYVLETTYNSETKKYKTKKAYYKGEYVLFEGKLYSVNANVNAGYEFTLQDILKSRTSFIPTNLGNEIKNLKNGTPFKFGIDNNGDYGYYKEGEDTITPFKNKHTESYKPTARANNLDMGLYHKVRYVDTTGVPNSNSGTYTATKNGTFDMGANNSYRYINVSAKAVLIGTYSSPTTINVAGYGASNSSQFFCVPQAQTLQSSGGNGHTGSFGMGWIRANCTYNQPSVSLSGSNLTIYPANLYVHGEAPSGNCTDSMYIPTAVYIIS